MKNHFGTAIRLGIFAFMFLYSPLVFTQITVDKFMGVTSRGQDPLNRLKAVGTVREFHPWVFNEGFTFPGPGSPAYPNNQYRWNPNYLDYIQYDDFYSNISGNGLTISPVTIRSIPQVVSPFLNQNDPLVDQILSQKPIESGADPTLPSSYISHAAYLYHYAARYGKTTFTSNRQNTLIAPRLDPNELVITGLGYLDYLENWNEPDQGNTFSSIEFAAILSADFDGHGQTMGLVVDPDNAGQMISTVGIKNADPSMKVVMGGLENADLDFIREIVDWSVANRPANATFGQIPFDVINIHRYLGNNPDFTQSTNGISPEEGGLRTILEEFVAYRDSLNPSIELWLSEFGYDTNENSNISVPTFGGFTQYQIQAQWLMRSYLETVAAGFDRAMIFDLRDGCTGGFCGTFESSGLLEWQVNDFKPKDSWYYVYTMKNVLTDMVFDADLSTCNDLSCPRIYRFIDPNNSNKRIYAVWHPTSNGTSSSINLSLEGANAATLVEMGVPSITGITSSLSGASPSISVSETPVFVIVGDSYNSGIGCTSNLTATDQTCGSVKVNWNAPNGVNKFQLWYMNGNQTAADFTLANATLVADEIDGNLLNYTVAGLPPSTPVTFFLIPEGVAVDINNPNTAAICFVQTSTLAVGNTCEIPLNPSMIFNPFVNLANATNLIDEQGSLDPFCLPASIPNTFWGFDFPADQSVTQERVSLDLGAYYNIDVLALYDGNAEGLLEIQVADSPNGPWTTVREYETISTNDWRYITDIFNNNPVRFLRFIASADDRVQIGELFLCGSLSNFNPDNPPGIVQSAVISAPSCNDISIDVVAPFDNDIANYKIQFGGTTQTIPFTGSAQTLVIDDLMEGNNYNFSIITVDNGGNESPPFAVSGNTLPSADCQTNCVAGCPTQLCLKPSWITDLTPIKPLDYLPIRLVDEQETAPVCGNGNNPTTEWGSEFDPFDNLPPVIAQLDLQAEYHLDSIYLFDGNSSGTFMVDYLDENGVYQPLINYFTSGFDTWALFENPTIHARYLRITKADLGGEINEIVIHGRPFTNVDPPSGDITNFMPSNVDCNNANLTWTLPVNSNITQIKLVVTTTISLVEVMLPTNASSYTINNLLPNTVYECFLFAENASTSPTQLDIVTFQTPSNGNCTNNNPPGPVANFQIIDTECDEIELSWQAPVDNDIAYYNLTVQPGNLDFSFAPLREPIAFKVDNLQASTNYQFTIKVIDLDGNESNTVSVSGTTLGGNQCGGNNNNGGNCDPSCPTYICVEESWIEDLTPTEHLDARRLFDEPHLGNPICGETGTPFSKWGEDYTPGLGIPPTIAIVDLQTSYNLQSIYLFDAESEGNFKVEYKNNSGNWVEITTYNTAPYNKWHHLNNLNITTQFLRFQKLNNPAKIAEVAIFGTPSGI